MCVCLFIIVGSHKDQFVDRLMKTYTSQAVYLLTTLVNMARARSCDSNEDERVFIDTVVVQIFEVCRWLFGVATWSGINVSTLSLHCWCSHIE